MLFLLACVLEAQKPDGADPSDSGEACTPSDWYADVDKDGFGSAAYTTAACVQPDGYVASAADCDDTSPAIAPGKTEVCNDLDDDCNGTADDAATDALTWYADNDGDGFGDAENSTTSCAAPTGFTADSADCDDTSFATNPSGTETCNGVDDDCDDVIDNDDAIDAVVWFADADADGYGDPDAPHAACVEPEGYTADNNDCDDTRASANPLASETCNGLDDDCDTHPDDNPTDPSPWYFDADSDGFGRATSPISACDQPANYVAEGTDCNDVDGSIYPGASESCDTTDSDCDGAVAEDDSVDALTWYADADGDLYGEVASTHIACSKPVGYVADATDCDDADAAISPADLEYCGGADENCDGAVDEDSAVDASTWHPDTDSDTYGDSDASHLSCTVPVGYVADASDCDDADATVSPVGTDTCADGIDQDCDGVVDAGCWPVGDVDVDAADAIVYGAVAGHGLGAQVCGGGDFSGDGEPDFLLSTSYVSYVMYAVYGDTTGVTAAASAFAGITVADYTSGLACQGDVDGDGDDEAMAVTGSTAQMFNGGSRIQAAQFYPEVTNSYFWSGGFGDTDGDGLAEVLVGRPYDGSGGATVYLFDAPSGYPALSTASARFTGFSASRAGYFLDSGSDVNGDGVDDVLVGSTAGSAWLFTGPFSGYVYASSADAALTGVAVDYVTVDFLADADGDGLADVLIGAPNDLDTCVIPGTTTGGTFRTEALGRVHTASWPYVGTSVAGLDIDGDGTSDVVTRSQYDYGVFAFFGPLTGTVDETDADTTFHSVGDYSLYAGSGTTIANAGDVEGLGFDSLLLTGPESDYGANASVGAAFLFHGAGH